MAIMREARPVWTLTLVLICGLGAVLLAGGVWLGFLGRTADTTFTLFGNQFASTSVGIAMAFIGVVMVVIAVRRVLSSLDGIASSGRDDVAS